MGGIGATKPADITKTYGTPLTSGVLKDPTNIPDGYRFDGWFENSALTNQWTGNSDLTTGTATQTIFARWKAKVTYNVNNPMVPSGVVADEYVILNQNTTLPTLQDATGWTFDTTNSWFEEASCTTLVGAAGSSYQVRAPKILYAKWIENEYSITLHVNSGTYKPGYTAPTTRSIHRKQLYLQKRI